MSLAPSRRLLSPLFPLVLLAAMAQPATGELDLLPSITVSPSNLEVKLETVASGGGLAMLGREALAGDR